MKAGATTVGPSPEARAMLERHEAGAAQGEAHVQPTRPRHVLNKVVAVLGARGVGKTAVSTRFATNKFGCGEYSPTIEDSHEFEVVVDKVTHNLTLLDTAGQSARTQLNTSYMIGVDGFVLMFNVMCGESFEICKIVNRKLMRAFAASKDIGMGNIPRALVANHIDRVGSIGTAARAVSRKEAQAYADSLGIPYFECSALTGEGVRAPFDELVRVSYNNWMNRGKDGGSVDASPGAPVGLDGGGATPAASHAAACAVGDGEGAGKEAGVRGKTLAEKTSTEVAKRSASQGQAKGESRGRPNGRDGDRRDGGGPCSLM
jgi:small GTP-binding protein